MKLLCLDSFAMLCVISEIAFVVVAAAAVVVVVAAVAAAVAEVVDAETLVR